MYDHQTVKVLTTAVLGKKDEIHFKSFQNTGFPWKLVHLTNTSVERSRKWAAGRADEGGALRLVGQ